MRSSGSRFRCGPRCRTQLLVRHGAHWYLSRTYSVRPSNYSLVHRRHQAADRSCTSRQQEARYHQYYDQNYTTPAMPPCWMIFEFSTSALSPSPTKIWFTRIFASVRDRRPATPGLSSRGYTASTTFATSVLITRACGIGSAASNPGNCAGFQKPISHQMSEFMQQLVVIWILLAKIAPGNHGQKLLDLLAEHPA